MIVGIIALTLFVIGYAFISFENIFRVSKAAVALTLGTLLWIIVVFSIHTKSTLALAFQKTGNEVFGVVMFLLASMALVEVMTEHHLFDWLKEKLAKLKLSPRKQFFLMYVLSFFLSSVLDNMVVGLVMIAVAKQFFKGKNLIIMAAGVIIGANAGGSWTPIGDVTTVLIWLAGKYDAFTIMKQGFIPAMVFLLVTGIFLLWQIESKHIFEEKVNSITKFSFKDKAVITLSIVSFLLPILANSFGLPPYLGLLFGLGVVWIFRQLSYMKEKGRGFYSMEEILKRLDIASIKFYTGILLCAGALYSLGVLNFLSNFIFGKTQEFIHVVWGSVFVGLLFAMVDNIPLTAISIKLITLQAQSFWVLLALTIGNGGSALLLGSAAGIAVMSNMNKELSVVKYFKIAFLPVIVGYAAMVGVWFLQYNLMK
jgi:Na+/H+ antiporter NhaD/arsenite permease-like protein